MRGFSLPAGRRCTWPWISTTYSAAVEKEIGRYAQTREEVHSIFFGGGTPSLMSPAKVAHVLETVNNTFDIQKDAEITLECNPGDADLEKLLGFKQAGVNRLSFGVQSLDDSVLKLLGRRHSSAEARQAAAWARQADVPNGFNLDFMFGL